MLLDPSSTFESVRENIGFLRTIVGDGCLPVTFCRMLPYNGTPIKDELVQSGRLRGDVNNPDYDSSILVSRGSTRGSPAWSTSEAGYTASRP